MKNLSCIFIFSAIAFAHSYAENDANSINKFVEAAEQITLKLSPGNLNDGVFKLEIIPASNKKEIVINKNAFFLFSADIVLLNEGGARVSSFKNILRDKYNPDYKIYKIGPNGIEMDMKYITYNVCDHIRSIREHINSFEYDRVMISFSFENLLPNTQDTTWDTNAISFTREEFLNWLEIAKSIPRESAMEEIIPGEPWPEGKEFPAPPESGKPVSRQKQPQ